MMWLPLVGQIARARREHLVVICARSRAGANTSKVVLNAAACDDDDLIAVMQKMEDQGFHWADEGDVRVGEKQESTAPGRRSVVQIVEHENPVVAVLEVVSELGIELLVLPRRSNERNRDDIFQFRNQLYRDAQCEVMLLRPGKDPEHEIKSIAVAVGGRPSAATVLNLSSCLAAVNDGVARAVYVEPSFGDLSRQVGQHILDGILRSSLRMHADRVEPQVVLHNDVASGLLEASSKDDMVLMGANFHGVVHRLLFSSIAEKIFQQTEDPAVAVVRSAMPLTSRLQRWGERALQTYVPQLDRSQRVGLFERVQSSSQWDFDFIVLIGLSTFIAALGLLQNSGAVVIGAMLVAPLMTPLLGTGLSLAQGNATLIRTTIGTILRGFLLAYAVGLAIGLVFNVMPGGIELTDQLRARGSPGVTDMLVAFVSGLVAAYAQGRPNLVSALPGVAIAAALVPPIATSGIGLAVGNWSLSWGALLLFLTNIVAIILAATCSLWAAGIRGTHQHGGVATWSNRILILLFLAAIAIATYEALPRADEKEFRVTVNSITKPAGSEVIALDIDRCWDGKVIHVDLAGATPLQAEIIDSITRAAALLYESDVEVIVHWEQVFAAQAGRLDND